MFKFTEEQIKRYARHIILPEVGGKGQEKLLNSKVLVIGAGVWAPPPYCTSQQPVWEPLV